MTEAPTIEQPVHWFALQINELAIRKKLLIVLLSMKTACLGKRWFLSYIPKVILANQIAWFFNEEYL